MGRRAIGGRGGLEGMDIVLDGVVIWMRGDLGGRRLHWPAVGPSAPLKKSVPFPEWRCRGRNARYQELLGT